MLRRVRRVFVRSEGSWSEAAETCPGAAILTIDESGAVTLEAQDGAAPVTVGTFDRTRGARPGDVGAARRLWDAELDGVFEPAARGITEGSLAARRRADDAARAVAEIERTMRGEMEARLAWMARHADVLGTQDARDAAPDRETERRLMARAAEALRRAGPEADVARAELEALRATERATFAAILERWGGVLGASTSDVPSFHALDADPLAPGLPDATRAFLDAVGAAMGLEL